MSKRHGIMLAYPLNENKLHKWTHNGKKVFVQPKFNGVRAWFNGKDLISSEGNVIVSVPHITMELRKIFEQAEKTR